MKREIISEKASENDLKKLKKWLKAELVKRREEKQADLWLKLEDEEKRGREEGSISLLRRAENLKKAAKIGWRRRKLGRRKCGENRQYGVAKKRHQIFENLGDQCENSKSVKNRKHLIDGRRRLEAAKEEKAEISKRSVAFMQYLSKRIILLEEEKIWNEMWRKWRRKCVWREIISKKANIRNSKKITSKWLSKSKWQCSMLAYVKLWNTMTNRSEEEACEKMAQCLNKWN